MSDPNEQQEPTMEEILASIRRIISEDDVATDDETDEAEPMALVEEEATGQQPPEMSDEKPGGEALELTEVVEDDGTVVSLAEEVPEPEPEPEPELDPLPPDAGLTSDDPGGAAASAFQHLSDTLTSGYDGDEKTLENLVAGLLRPMLRQWLDANLPQIVERLVAEEIDRLSRRS